eukprot:CAMPEP_0175130622 /NCGR_PEP_ID=MMETSP0087-20121206/6103_1 /TAXON_ID=136419 /ORGANISM="Unknown Unknown, Strain D1" /LENGTH=82 /DNA_ID=CAMNT_0016412849 /DNA_START=50 /DNA_END=298 /DNA_ORIENTATION=-
MAASDENQVSACRDQILALKKCHSETALLYKMFGKCNDIKFELDKCMRQQKTAKQRERAQHANFNGWSNELASQRAKETEQL